MFNMQRHPLCLVDTRTRVLTTSSDRPMRQCSGNDHTAKAKCCSASTAAGWSFEMQPWCEIMYWKVATNFRFVSAVPVTVLTRPFRPSQIGICSHFSMKRSGGGRPWCADVDGYVRRILVVCFTFVSIIRFYYLPYCRLYKFPKKSKKFQKKWIRFRPSKKMHFFLKKKLIFKKKNAMQPCY